MNVRRPPRSLFAAFCISDQFAVSSPPCSWLRAAHFTVPTPIRYTIRRRQPPTIPLICQAPRTRSEMTTSAVRDVDTDRLLGRVALAMHRCAVLWNRLWECRSDAADDATGSSPSSAFPCGFSCALTASIKNAHDAGRSGRRETDESEVDDELETHVRAGDFLTTDACSSEAPAASRRSSPARKPCEISDWRGASGELQRIYRMRDPKIAHLSSSAPALVARDEIEVTSACVEAVAILLLASS